MKPHPFTPEEIIILASLEEAVQYPDATVSGFNAYGDYFAVQFIWSRTEQGANFWGIQELRFQKHNYKIARR